VQACKKDTTRHYPDWHLTLEYDVLWSFISNKQWFWLALDRDIEKW
jgi:lipoprotein signal peptidase